MRTYANLLVISFEKKLMPGWKVVPNKVEMHTDGKPRVVRVCDVGVSKGCVCFFFLVGGLKMKVLKTTNKQKKKTKCIQVGAL